MNLTSLLALSSTTSGTLGTFSTSDRTRCSNYNAMLLTMLELITYTPQGRSVWTGKPD